jgi:hypothetical protein
MGCPAQRWIIQPVRARKEAPGWARHAGRLHPPEAIYGPGLTLLPRVIVCLLCCRRAQAITHNLSEGQYAMTRDMLTGTPSLTRWR